MILVHSVIPAFMYKKISKKKWMRLQKPVLPLFEYKSQFEIHQKSLSESKIIKKKLEN